MTSHPPIRPWQCVCECAALAVAPALALLLLLAASGCRTAPSLPPVDLTQPGWNVREGQALWRSKSGAPEVAGELLVSLHPDGRGFVQFTKTPLPLVTAQTGAGGWQIEFSAENRRYSGSGPPPSRIVWFQLLRALRGAPVAGDWTFTSRPGDRWSLQRISAGEMLEGYVVARPSQP